jgi:hypothetical protein
VFHGEMSRRKRPGGATGPNAHVRPNRVRFFAMKVFDSGV